MLFIATHGITAHLWGGNPQAVFLAIFAIYPLAIGIGLWFLRPSARYFLMTICGLTLGYTIRGLFINTALSGTFLYNPALSPALQQPAVFSLLLIDAFILYYLWMGDGVSKAFGSK
jgi:hypothetical protein